MSNSEATETTVNNIHDFTKWINELIRDSYLFRGLPDKEWDIEPSTYRRLDIKHRNTDQLLKINQELIEDAKTRGHNRKDGRDMYDLELLAELQHYGAATCLIDFSYSALVALWFACQTPDIDGVVFAVRNDDTTLFRKVNTSIVRNKLEYFFELPEEHAQERTAEPTSDVADRLGVLSSASIYPLWQWGPAQQNQRIIAQQSMFIFGGAKIKAEAHCIIAHNSKQDILAELEKIVHLTEATMFPDFHGFASLNAHDKPYIKPYPKDYYRRGIEAHRQNNLESAIEYYTKAIKLKPEAIKLKPNYADAYHSRGIAYGQQDQYDQAIQDFTRSIELQPDSALVLYNRGTAYGNKGQHDRAIKDFTKSIELQPNNAAAWNNRGLAYSKKDQHDQAIQDFTRSIELRPNLALMWHNRGIIYDKKGQLDQAIRDYTRVIELQPNAVAAWYNRGHAYSKKDQHDQAIQDFTKFIELQPNDFTAWYNRGNAYNVIGKHDQAIQDFTRSIELQLNNAAAWNNRGVAYSKKDQYDQAIQDFTKSIELQPTFAEAYLNRGIAYSKKGQHDQVFQDYTKAIELQPNDAELWYNRGLAYERIEEFDKSIPDFIQAINLNPPNSPNNVGIFRNVLECLLNWHHTHPSPELFAGYSKQVQTLFYQHYQNIEAFEQAAGWKVPPQIRALLERG